jgi:hypothetical protein
MAAGSGVTSGLPATRIEWGGGVIVYLSGGTRREKWPGQAGRHREYTFSFVILNDRFDFVGR